MNNPEIFYPANIEEWRKWLVQNHVYKQSVWLVFYSKKSKKESITWSEAVDVALCFGWIDSKKIKIDQETSHQFFSKRKPNSTWSKINKEKVQQLVNNGLMADAGLHCVNIAKQNGSWTILNDVEQLIIPNDLENAFKKHIDSKAYFLSLSKSIRKIMLTSLVLAKRPETRLNRIEDIITKCKQTK